MSLKYFKLFDPDKEIMPAGDSVELADRAPARAYVFNDEITLAVNVALATNRPLLVRGPSGCGKSSLAHAVARRARWSYVEKVITSRTQGRDLLYEIDLLKRLQDARADRLKGDERYYILPGPLFWAFNWLAAEDLLMATDRANRTPEGVYRQAERMVVLLDEIDKADPDIPNDLLRPLGLLKFPIDELGLTIEAAAPERAPLVIMTTNEERDLPPAFLRRCVELVIESPNVERLVAIGKAHHHDMDDGMLREMAKLVSQSSRKANGAPSTAEYLDVLRACRALNISPSDEVFEQLAKATLRKDAPMETSGYVY